MLRLGLDLRNALDEFGGRSDQHRLLVEGILSEAGLCANRYAASTLSQELGMPLNEAKLLLAELRQHLTERGLK